MIVVTPTTRMSSRTAAPDTRITVDRFSGDEMVEKKAEGVHRGLVNDRNKYINQSYEFNDFHLWKMIIMFDKRKCLQYVFMYVIFGWFYSIMMNSLDSRNTMSSESEP